MSEYFRVVSIAEYEPNIPPRGDIGTSRSALLIRDEVTSDDFSVAMLLGANFRTTSKIANRFDQVKNFSTSTSIVGAALQLSNSPQLRQFSALTQSRNASVTPSRAEGVANHAIDRI
jgi:hypothetical protein